MSVLDEYIANEYVKDKLEKAGDEHFSCRSAEESIIRRMLKDQGTAVDVSGLLTGKDFSSMDYGRIFNAMQNVVDNNGGVDIITVEEALRRMFPKNAKRLVEVAVELINRPTSSDDNRNIADHVKIVKDLSVRRVAIKSFESAMRDLNNPMKNIESVLTEIESLANGIDTTEASVDKAGDVLLSTFDYIERRSKGEIVAITTGVDALDKLIGGFYPGELTIIAARPSVGKTAFGLNVAVSAAQKGFRVCFVSCEMSTIGLGQRLFSRIGLIDGMALRKGELDPEQWTRMSDAMLMSEQIPVSFVFDENDVEDVVTTANRMAQRGEIDILIVDYLQFMDTKREFREERHKIGYISKALKMLSKSAKIPVIALAQVTRDGEGVMPTMKMLRESGNIEQDADNIIFLHRPNGPEDRNVDPRDREYFETFAEKGNTYLCIGVSKQRNGIVGQVCVAFNPAYMLYSTIDRTGAT